MPGTHSFCPKPQHTEKKVTVFQSCFSLLCYRNEWIQEDTKYRNPFMLTTWIHVSVGKVDLQQMWFAVTRWLLVSYISKEVEYLVVLPVLRHKYSRWQQRKFSAKYHLLGYICLEVLRSSFPSVFELCSAAEESRGENKLWFSHLKGHAGWYWTVTTLVWLTNQDKMALGSCWQWPKKKKKREWWTWSLYVPSKWTIQKCTEKSGPKISYSHLLTHLSEQNEASWQQSHQRTEAGSLGMCMCLRVEGSGVQNNCRI